MKVGEIWINKEFEDIYLKIIEFKKDNYWKVFYINCVGPDLTPFDIMSGETIYKNFYLDTMGLEIPEEMEKGWI